MPPLYGTCEMHLDQMLRKCVLRDESISKVARESGIPQPTLQEFVVGKRDGGYADIRLSSAQKLMEYFGIDETLHVPEPAQKRSRRMLLADELKLGECSDSPEKFKERLIAGMMEYCPEQTIDGLVCNPLVALDFCNQIREGIGTESLADVVILKALINVRKRKDCPTGLKKQRTRRVLHKALDSCNCDLPSESFKELVSDCLADMYKNQTIDEIVCHPREARMLCNHVRDNAGCSTLSDELILSTLMNIRKQG